MNRQRKVVITTTYNDLGIIVDTKAEELDLSVQPNSQPTCNNLATDTISRQSAIDAMKRLYDEDVEAYGCEIPEMFDSDRAIEALKELPSVQPEPYRGEQ